MTDNEATGTFASHGHFDQFIRELSVDKQPGGPARRLRWNAPGVYLLYSWKCWRIINEKQASLLLPVCRVSALGVRIDVMELPLDRRNLVEVFPWGLLAGVHELREDGVEMYFEQGLEDSMYRGIIGEEAFGLITLDRLRLKIDLVCAPEIDFHESAFCAMFLLEAASETASQV